MRVIIIRVARCANACDFDIFIENAAFGELHFADQPKIKIIRFFLKLPKIFGKLLLVVFKLSVVWAKRGRDADDEIVRLRADLSLQRIDDARINILRAAAPTGMSEGDRFMDWIVKNRRLAIGMGNS